MFYRRKYYRLSPEIVEPLNELFREVNLPNQLKHGSRLIGRWMLSREDGDVDVFAIWEYDNKEAYQEIEASIRRDAEHVARIKSWYDCYGGRDHVVTNLFKEVRDEEIESTLV